MIWPAVVHPALDPKEPIAAATIVGTVGGTNEPHIRAARFKDAEVPEAEQAGRAASAITSINLRPGRPPRRWMVSLRPDKPSPTGQTVSQNGRP